MNRIPTIFYLTIFICVFFSKNVFSAVIYSANSTNWNIASTWEGGVIPTNTDTVIIDGHDVFIQSIDSVSILRLEIHNAKNLGHSSLIVKNNGVLKISGDLKMTADNYDFNVILSGINFSRIYVDGNVSINRLSSNFKGELLQLNLKNTAEFYTGGSFNFTYESSSFGETNKEILLEDFSKLVVEGATVFNVTGGLGFDVQVTHSAVATFDGGLDVNMSGGTATLIESNETAVLNINGNVNLVNTNPTVSFFDLSLFTGSSGGTIVIDGDLKLESTVDKADVKLVSETGISNITITGDLILEADHDNTVKVRLGAAAVLQLGGDILRPKNFGELEMNDFSVLELNGTTQQTIPTNKLPDSDGDSLYIRQVVFNNPNGFILQGDLIVYDSLELKNGIFYTTDDNMLIVADGAKVSGGSDSSYVDGPMTKLGAVENEPFLFPLGDNGKYAPVEIIPLGTSPTSSYTGGYEKCPPPFDKITSAPLDQISGTQYWTITRTVGSQNIDIALHWQDASAEGINNLDSMVVAGLNPVTETWESMGSGGTTGGVGVDVQGSVKNDEKNPPPFDRIHFTLGTHAGVNALPSEMISFEGKKRQNKIDLNWVTASEISSDLFIVERSIDGASFEEIARVDAQGNSNTFQRYIAEDKSPHEGMNYYRLQRVDLDGSNLPTEIIGVNFTKEKKTARIYPNPVQDFVNIVLENEDVREVEIGVFNQNGQQIFEGVFNPTGNELNLPIEQINIKERGVYTILYHNGIHTETLRFVKVE